MFVQFLEDIQLINGSNQQGTSYVTVPSGWYEIKKTNNPFNRGPEWLHIKGTQFGAAKIYFTKTKGAKTNFVDKLPENTKLADINKIK